MAKAQSKVLIPLSSGRGELDAYLRKYHAEFQQKSSSEKGHVYWSAPVGMWILVMKKGNNAQVTFHHVDNCPCQYI